MAASDNSAAAAEWARKRREQTELARARRAERLGVREDPRGSDGGDGGTDAGGGPRPAKSELDQLHELGDQCVRAGESARLDFIDIGCGRVRRVV